MKTGMDGRQSWPKLTAVLLSAGAVALAGLPGALFRKAPHGIEPVLQPHFVSDAQWLPAPTAGFDSADVVQWSAVRGTTLIVMSVLLCAVLVALIAYCTLILTRFSVRRNELATRAALGAAPGELLRELTRPIVPILLLGGVSGLALGAALVWLVVAVWPAHVDAALSSLILRAAVSGLLCLLLQAVLATVLLWRFAVRRNLAELLRAGERATSSLAETRVRELLTIAQISACVVLLTVGLSLATQSGRSTGVSAAAPDSLVVWSETLEGLSRAERVTHLEQLLQERREPNIPAESLASAGALVGVGLRDWLLAECDNCIRMRHALLAIPMHSVGPGYFTVLGNVVRGRDFGAGDRSGAEPVVIVNDSFVKQMFGPSGNGLDRHVWLRAGMGEAYRIVGVIPDEENQAPGASGRGQPVIYFSALQQPPVAIDRIARRSSAAAAEATFVSLRALRSAAALPVRYAARSIQISLLLCLILAAYGLHATAQTLIRGRRRELGVRLALGSAPAGLTRYVAGYGARLLIVALLLGGWLAFGAQRILAGALPGVRPDWSVLLLSIAALSLAVFTGVLGPARGVAREAPANPLRG